MRAKETAARRRQRAAGEGRRPLMAEGHPPSVGIDGPPGEGEPTGPRFTGGLLGSEGMPQQL